jgi:hypothetical protein
MVVFWSYSVVFEVKAVTSCSLVVTSGAKVTTFRGERGAFGLQVVSDGAQATAPETAAITAA